MDKATPHAKIHGIIVDLSPMTPSKSQSCNFFHGHISDGKKRIRLVGFDKEKRKMLSDYHINKQPVTLEDCEVKQASQSQDLEVYGQEVY